MATTINYIDRANLGVAAPIMREELNISPEMMGLILGGFFWTYAVMYSCRWAISSIVLALV